MNGIPFTILQIVTMAPIASYRTKTYRSLTKPSLILKKHKECFTMLYIRKNMSEIDDYFVEDIINQKERKKKVNSKGKGARGELELVKLLSKRFPGKSFFRVVGSGNRGSQVPLTEQAAEVMTGDVAGDKLRLSIECKY